MPTQSVAHELVQAVRVVVVGRVQGLGARPTAARVAASLGLAGGIANTSDGLLLELEGSAGELESFLRDFRSALPAGAEIDELRSEPIMPRGLVGFEIGESDGGGARGAAVPPDQVVCPRCLAEVRDASDRRHDYAFTSCTTCGPRYSILQAMPYDRAATSMGRFVVCAECLREYRAPSDRRFHAQTNACPNCGPRLVLQDADGRSFDGDAALRGAVEGLRLGKIVALLGVGGYQLLVDACSTDSARRLRERKRRPTKPLAVLIGNLEAAEQLATLNDAERTLLQSPAGPIVVVRRRAKTPLAEEIAPGVQTVGLMLPTTPLHALLCDRFSGPLVCTSANVEGEPLVYEVADATRELHGIADLWLHHDRPVIRPVDDSVVRVVGGEQCIMRMARGYAPHVLPPLPDDLPGPIVALGGEQHSAFALWNGSQAVLGSHVGDLQSSAACERWGKCLESTAELYGIEVSAADVIHDRHPDYFSTQWARRFPRCRAVQHHHAHIAAVLYEHGVWDREVLGLAWDGTGYGADGTIWGGECLRADVRDFRRIAWLRPFALLGGDAAVREPWRIAAALICDALGPEAARRRTWCGINATRFEALVTLMSRPQLAIRTSSMGRLFDGIAALTLGTSTADYESRPAMLLEESCDLASDGSYAFHWNESTGEIDWREVIVRVADDLAHETSPGTVAMRFHRAVADLAATLAAAHPELPLATSGGVFQNKVLGELLAERVGGRSAGWLRPRSIPPGDGGLAAGQLAIAAARAAMRNGQVSPCV